MTHKKNTISIYDYPEHLNPFREGAEDSDDKFNTTGRRRSSFRVNAWNIFPPNKGNSKAFQDINPVSSSAASRFMTWTPKLLRKTSFLRSSPSRSTVGPRELKTPTVTFRSNATQCTLPPASSRSSLPPTSSRSALHSNSSRATLPPDNSLYTFSASKPTSPPGRPAPPNARTSLSPGRPLSPGPITLAVTPSTENAPNNVNTGSRQTTPVPAVCKVSFPATSSENTVGEQPSKDEIKYVKQGAKPKKKRRAPVPPVSSPGKSTSDTRQLNSNESDVSVASTVTASSAENPPPHEETATATSHLEVTALEPQPDAKNREQHDHWIKKSEQLNREQILNSENGRPKLHSEKETEHSDQSKDTQKDPQELEGTHFNGHSEGGDEMDIVRKGDNLIIAENVLNKQVEYEEFRGSKSAHGYPELQNAPENELQENINQPEDENLTCQQELETDSAERRNHLDDGVQDSETDDTNNMHTLHNGNNFSSENIGLQNGQELNLRNIQEIEKLTKPEPKPRTGLPSMPKN